MPIDAAGVWTDVVGQPQSVAALSAATHSDARLAHAWLFTGPPGSGRSTAARAFAAALLCSDHGCGTCTTCRTALVGSHADVHIVATEHVFLKVDDVRPLISTAQQRPTSGKWRIMIIEDADRLNETSGNVLLKAIEEPPERTIWMLCAPSREDVLVTIRSRCRHVGLQIPSTEAITELLIRRDGVAPDLAEQVARASGGHIGVARRLARDEDARNRRRDILLMPRRLTGVAQAMVVAAELAEVAKTEAAAATSERDAHERAELLETLGATGLTTLPPAIRSQVRQLEENQKRRATRAQRDVLDRALTDLLTLFRDVLTVQLGAEAQLINSDLANEIHAMAQLTEGDVSIRRMDIITKARERIWANVAAPLALEAMLVGIYQSARALPDPRAQARERLRH